MDRGFPLPFGADNASLFQWALLVAAKLNGAPPAVYTPTPTIVTNLDTVTMDEAQYSYIDGVVTVSGRFTADATATALTEFTADVPIASSMTAAGQAGGVLSANSSDTNGRVHASTSGGMVRFRWTAPSTSSTVFSYIYQYRVI